VHQNSTAILTWRFDLVHISESLGYLKEESAWGGESPLQLIYSNQTNSVIFLTGHSENLGGLRRGFYKNCNYGVNYRKTVNLLTFSLLAT